MMLIFGTVPYILLIEKGVDTLNVVSVTAIVMLLLLLAGLAAIIWLTLIVKLDKETKTVTFTRPFRLRSTTIHFDEVVGFRYKYLSGKIEYKALQVKTITGRTFTFSDFETENLRDFEKEFIKLFDIRKGNSFYKLNQEQKRIEVENSLAFDLEQAKEIRFILYAVIAFCLIFLASIVKKIFDNDIRNLTTTMIAATILTTILVLTISKLKRTNRLMKKPCIKGD